MANKSLDLAQHRAEVHDSVAALLKQAESRDKRGLTAEERETVKTKFEEIEGIDAEIAANAKLSTLNVDKIDIGRAAFIESAHEFHLEKPFGYERCQRLWDSKAKNTPDEKAYRISSGMGEQLQAIRAAEMSQKNPLYKTDDRLHELNSQYQKRSAPSGMSEQVPADGGFLIFPDFSTEILKLSFETGNVYTRGRKIPISDATNAIKLPAIDQTSRVDGSRWGGVRAYWMNEADTLTSSKPKFRLLELQTKKLGVLYYATDEVVADATALGSIVMQAFGEELGYKMDDAAINGDGNGKPQGIIRSPAKIAVSKESGQTAATINLANIVKMWARMWLRSRRNAVWFVNQDVEPQLLLLNTDTSHGISVVAGIAPAQDGTSIYGPIYNPPSEQRPFGTLLGRPVIPIEQCATLGTEGDIILADMSQWVYIDKGNPLMAASMHVRFLYDEMTYRMIYRTDGQGWWHTPLTPANGSNTVSPFITLATRS